MRSTPARAVAAALAAILLIPPACSTPSETSAIGQHADTPENPTQPPPRPIPDYPTGSIVTTNVPIELGGAGAVTDSGEATYTLPLHVPDGPRGMQPSLSLSYRNGGANGHLGSGFSLAGLSAIAPCAQQVASEGVADGVDFDASDAYCLDGSKLVEVVDPHYAAPAGTARVYRTEVESFSRVVAKLAPEERQPVEFVVHTRDGNTHTYKPVYAQPFHGVDEQHMVLDEDRYHRVAFVYLLDRTTDPSGNRVVYTYESADAIINGEASYRIKSIGYAYAGGSPRREVRFTYQGRADPIVRWFRGVKIVNRSLIRQIQITAPNPTTVANVWNYHLAFFKSSDTGDSLLTSIQLCATQGGCSYPRYFDWTKIDNKPADQSWTAADAEFDDWAMGRAAVQWASYFDPSSTLNWIPQTDVRVLLYDADTDGDDDALYRTLPPLSSIGIGGDQGAPQAAYDFAAGRIRLRRSEPGAPLQQVLIPNLETGMSIANLGKSRIADFDGNGTLDLQTAQTHIEQHLEVLPSGKVHVGKWTYGYETKQYTTTTTMFQDMPGSVPAIAMSGPAAIADWNPIYDAYLLTHKLIQDPPFQRVLADLDGDGRADSIDAVRNVNILDYPNVDWNDRYADHAGAHPYEATLATGSALQLGQTWACGNGRARVLDVDGDGRDDMAVTHDAVPGPYRALGLGDTGSPQIADTSELWAGACGPEPDNNPDLVVGDWNGDGLVDALYPPGSRNNNTEALVRWNLGAGYGPLEVFPVHSTSSSATAADLRQDAPLGRNFQPIPWDRGTRVVDVNNDGRTDIVAFRQDNAACVTNPLLMLQNNLPTSFACTNRLIVFVSNGDSFEANQQAIHSKGGAHVANGFTTATVGDVTGDGAVDAVWVVDRKLQVVELPWRWTPDRLAAVRDGMTPFPLEEFVYSRSWWGDAARPTPRASCPYPLACSYRGFEVVREHRVFAGTRADGTPMIRTFLHTFDEYASDQRGRGGLGARLHRIWDRERGIETIRRFDETRHDPLPATPGGEFYPGAREPSEVITITPLSVLPSDAQIAGATAAPGLFPNERVRVTRIVNERELRHDPTGRILTILPRKRTARTVDVDATIDPGAALPRYAFTLPGIAIEEVTSIMHDAYGAPTQIMTTNTGGVTRTRIQAFQHDLANWRLDLQTTTLLMSVDADDAASPVRVKTTTFDAYGREETVTTSAMLGGTIPGTTQAFLYDGRGNVVQMTSTAADAPVPRVLKTYYDTDGVYSRAVVDSYGTMDIRLVHPAFGVAIYEEDPLLVARASKYDVFRRLVETSRPGTPTLTRTYSKIVSGNHRGVRIDDKLASGDESYRNTDELGRETGTGLRGFDGTWLHDRRVYDGNGLVTSEGRPSLATTPMFATAFTYDRLGRVAKAQRADGPVVTWTRPELTVGPIGLGALTTVRTDPEGHLDVETRDLDGRVIATGHVGGTYGRLDFAYAPFDQIEEVRNAGTHTTHYQFDGLGRSVKQIDPGTGTTDLRYNGYGELVERTDANGTTTMTYDRLGRMVTATDPSGGVIEREFAIGGNGTRQVVRELSPDGVELRTDYDAFGRVQTVRQTIDGITDRIDQIYDAYGRLRLRLYPEVVSKPRFTTIHTWNGFGYLSKIEDISVGAPVPIWTVVSRDLDLSLRQAIHGTDFLERREHDPHHGLPSLVELKKSGSPVALQSYEYDADDLLDRRVDGSRIETFDHDLAHRLDWWSVVPRRLAQPIVTDYDYDQRGNLQTVKRDSLMTWSGAYGGVGFRPDQLRSSTTNGTTKAYAYDDTGRQTVAGDRTTTWTHHDKPRTVSSPGWSHEYTYGARNERVQDTTSSKTVTYVGKLYERHAPTAGTTRHTFMVPGTEGVVAQVSYEGASKTMLHYVSDSLGSAWLVLDAANIVERTWFAPFGGRVDADGLSVIDPDRKTTIGFTGHEEDERALVNMNGRIYDLAQYRFTSPDPIVGRPFLGQARNPYSYVMNNPLHFTDPSGFDPPDVGGGGEPPPQEPSQPPPGYVYGGGGDEKKSGGDVDHGQNRWSDDNTPREMPSYVRSVLLIGLALARPTVVRPERFRAFEKCYRPGYENLRDHELVLKRAEGVEPAKAYSNQVGKFLTDYMAKDGMDKIAAQGAESANLFAQVWTAQQPISWGMTAAELLGEEELSDAIAMAALIRPRWTRRPTNADRAWHYNRVKGQCTDCKVVMTRKAGPHQMQLDHSRSLARGGPAIDPLDAVPRCRDCNGALGKWHYDLDEWLESFIIYDLVRGRWRRRR